MSLPVLPPGFEDAFEEVAGGFEFVLIGFAPVAGEFAGDGGLEDGLAVALEQFLDFAQGFFAFVDMGEEGFDLFDDPVLFVAGATGNSRLLSFETDGGSLKVVPALLPPAFPNGEQPKSNRRT